MIKNFLKGMAIGVANALPGVSGGTIAVVLNIYDKLTESIGNFFTASKEKKIEYIKFLSQIGIGAVVGILLLAKIITVAYNEYPKITTLCFLVLIVPSIPYILKGEKITDKKNLFFLFLGVLFTAVFMYGISGVSEAAENGATVVKNSLTFSYGMKLFLCGMVAAGAMVIPGISGALLLMLLGEYYNIFSYISDVGKNVLTIFNGISEENIMKIKFLLIFSLGVFIGLIGVSKAINILLKKYKSYTLHFIVGIIIVSLLEVAKNLF